MAVLQNAIDRIAVLVGAVPGVRVAYNYPPDQIPSSGIFAIIYPYSGRWEFNTTLEKRGVHEVAIDVLTPHKDTAYALKILSPMIDSIPNAVMADISVTNDVLGGTIDTFENIRYEQITLDWAGQPYIGFRFYVEGVKIRTAIT